MSKLAHSGSQHLVIGAQLRLVFWLFVCLTFGSRELMAKNMATKIAAPPTLRVVFHIRYGRKT